MYFYVSIVTNSDSPHHIASLRELLEEDYTDLGGNANIWHRQPNEHTCMAPNTKEPTRRDYISACPSKMSMITDFAVDHQQEFPVNSVLLVTYCGLSTPACFAELDGLVHSRERVSKDHATKKRISTGSDTRKLVGYGNVRRCLVFSPSTPPRIVAAFLL